MTFNKQFKLLINNIEIAMHECIAISMYILFKIDMEQFIDSNINWQTISYTK